MPFTANLHLDRSEPGNCQPVSRVLWTLGDSLEAANQNQDCFCGGSHGVLDRLALNDAAWDRISPLIIGRPDQRGSTRRDNRMFVEGALRIVCTGSPWRNLPEVFGERNSVFRRFSRWSRKGVWWRIFEAMSDDPDFECLIVDTPPSFAFTSTRPALKKGVLG
jgi:transposase